MSPSVQGILINARSLLNKLVEFQSLLLGTYTGEHYDIIAITETWLGSEVPDSMVCSNAADFLIFRKDRCGRMGVEYVFYTQTFTSCFSALI